MTGDAERQPVEGVETLTDLAADMDGEESDTPEIEDEDGDPEAPDEDAAEDEEESDDPDEDEDEADEPTFTIKVDGKEVTVTQSELIELGQKGSDYTNKTMAVAEERKAVEAEKAKAAELRAQREQALGEAQQRLQAYQQFMASQLGNPPPQSLLESDPRAYLIAKEQHEARKGQLHQVNAELQHLQEVSHRERQEALLREAEATEKALRDTLPGWNDESLNELSAYMQGQGLEPALNEAFVSKGLWTLAHKARAYDALQAEKAKLKPVAKLSKVHKPSASNQPVKRSDLRRKEAEQRYAAKPSLNTLADLIE